MIPLFQHSNIPVLMAQGLGPHRRDFMRLKARGFSHSRWGHQACLKRTILEPIRVGLRPVEATSKLDQHLTVGYRDMAWYRWLGNPGLTQRHKNRDHVTNVRPFRMLQYVVTPTNYFSLYFASIVKKKSIDIVFFFHLNPVIIDQDYHCVDWYRCLGQTWLIAADFDAPHEMWHGLLQPAKRLMLKILSESYEFPVRTSRSPHCERNAPPEQCPSSHF